MHFWSADSQIEKGFIGICRQPERVAYYVVLYKRIYKVHKPEHRLSYLSIINTNSYRECVLCLWCVGTYIPSVGINITHFGGTLFGFAYRSVRQRPIILQKGGNYTSPTLYVFCVKKKCFIEYILVSMPGSLLISMLSITWEWYESKRSWAGGSELYIHRCDTKLQLQ